MAAECPYAVLSVAPDAALRDITVAYRKLARKWHPDKYRGNPERGSRKMREVSEAKKVLSERFKCKCLWAQRKRE